MWRFSTMMLSGGTMATGVGLVVTGEAADDKPVVSMAQLLEIADKAGVILILLLILIGGYRGWWVFGRSHKEAQARCEVLDRELKEARDEVKEFNARLLELIRQMSPLLADATRALGEAGTGMEVTMRRRPIEAEEVLRRLEAALRDIDDRRGRG